MAAFRRCTLRFGISRYAAVSAAHSITNGRLPSKPERNGTSACSSPNSGSASRYVLNASATIRNAGPRLNTVQYITKRMRTGRFFGTRQMRLNASSMLSINISVLTMRTIMPSAVALFALSANCVR